MQFSKPKHPVLTEYLNLFGQKYDKESYPNNGPLLLSEAVLNIMNKVCISKTFTNMILPLRQYETCLDKINLTVRRCKISVNYKLEDAHISVI